MRAKIVRIGNSQGVRIPKPLIEQAGMGEEIELKVVGRTIVIESARTAREGWSRAFEEMATAADDVLLDESVPTRFDEAEWEW